MGDSGRRLNDLIRLDSSLEEIIQDKESETNNINDRVKRLEAQRDSANDQITKYKEILDRYSNEEKAILQRIEDYDSELKVEKERSQELFEGLQHLKSENRELTYRFNLALNDKAVLENILEKEHKGQDESDKKDTVIQELSKDITLLENKIKKLQENNEKLDIQNRNLNDTVMTLDAKNIELNEKVLELEPFKEEVAMMVEEKDVKEMNEEETDFKVMQLTMENDQYKTMIEQLSKRIDEIEFEREGVDEREVKLSEQTEKLMA